MINFFTFFLPFQQIHVGKDVGQIPFLLQRDKKYKSKIIVSKSTFNVNDEFYIRLKGKRYFLYLNAVRYILFNRKKMDVLNLYHFNPLTILIGLLYKTCHRKGILFIKADFVVDQQEIFFKKKGLFKYFLKNFLKKIDILVVENERGYQYFKNLQKFLPNANIIKAPNGIDYKYAEIPVSYSLKKNIILYVGRVSARTKNTHFFLEVLQKVKLKDWQVKIIGPIDNDMEVYINKMYNNFPELKKKVFFIGSIFNKFELYKEYVQAKVVCLTSKSEGFPLVLPEALFFGCYFISTNSSPSINEMISNEKIGKVVPVDSLDEFCNAIENYINLDDNQHENNFNYLITRREEFTWNNTIEKIDNAIKTIMNDKNKF